MAAAKQSGKSDVDVEELLCALSRSGGIAQFVLDEIGWTARVNPTVGEVAIDECELSNSAFLSEIVTIAHQEARAIWHRFPGTEHILLAVVRVSPQTFEHPHSVRHEVMKILGLELPKP